MAKYPAYSFPCPLGLLHPASSSLCSSELVYGPNHSGTDSCVLSRRCDLGAIPTYIAFDFDVFHSLFRSQRLPPSLPHSNVACSTLTKAGCIRTHDSLDVGVRHALPELLVFSCASCGIFMIGKADCWPKRSLAKKLWPKPTLVTGPTP